MGNKSHTTRATHALIHALSGQEKRYFKLFAAFTGKSEENNYSKLFDLLHQMPEYSDETFGQLVAEQPYAGHLPSTVHHLFHLILRSLKSYHWERKEEDKVRELIASARILLEKGLYDPALKLLKRARKRANEIADQMLGIEAVELEKQILFRKTSSRLGREMDERQKESMRLLEEARERLIISNLMDQHKILRRMRFDSRASQRSVEFEAIRNHPALGRVPTNPMNALTWHSLQGHDALMRRDTEAAYRHFQSVIQTLDEQRWLGRDRPDLLIGHLSDFLYACMYSKRWLEAEKVIERLHSVPIRTPEDEFAQLNESLFARLFYSLNTFSAEEGEAVIERVEELLKTHSKRLSINRQLGYYYNITIFLFLRQEYRLALKWLNRILHFPGSELKQNLRDFARLFQLVLHYELGNQDLVEYLFRSTYRHYQEKKRLLPFEKIVLNGLREVFFREKDLRELATVLYEQLWELARNPKGKEPSGLYELIFWVESKRDGLPLKEVFARRVRERMELVEKKAMGAEPAEIEALEAREVDSQRDKP